MTTHSCVICSGAEHRNVDDAYRAAADAVAAARIRYAESFLLWKQRGRGNTSDEKARQHAVIDTRDELTTLLAELEIAKEAYRQYRA